MVMEGGIVPICPSLSVYTGTGVEPRVGWPVVCRAGWQAGRPAVMTGWLAGWVGGVAAQALISVMICMDVSLSGSRTRL